MQRLRAQAWQRGGAGSSMTGAIAVPPWVNEGDYADADDKRHSDILRMEKNVPLEAANTHKCAGIISTHIARSLQTAHQCVRAHLGGS